MADELKVDEQEELVEVCQVSPFDVDDLPPEQDIFDDGPDMEDEGPEETEDAEDSVRLSAEDIAVRCELGLDVLGYALDICSEDTKNEVAEAIQGLGEIKAQIMAEADEAEGDVVNLLTVDDGTANAQFLLCLEAIQKFRKLAREAGGSIDGKSKIVITFEVETPTDTQVSLTSSGKLSLAAVSLEGHGRAVLGEDGVFRHWIPEPVEPTIPTLPGTEAEDQECEDGDALPDEEAESLTQEVECDE